MHRSVINWTFAGVARVLREALYWLWIGNLSQSQLCGQCVLLNSGPKGVRF